MLYYIKYYFRKWESSMERKLSRIPVMVLTAILAVLAFCLRNNQLKTAFDAIGVIPGSGSLLIWIALLVIVLFAAYSFFLRGRKKYAAISSRHLPLMILTCAAALLLAVGSILFLKSGASKADVVLAVGGVLVAACWIGAGFSRFQAKRAPVVLFLIPAVFYLVELVLKFRLWTQDPVILDYCYDLGALICTMCSLFHLTGYCFDKGSRRLSVFFSLSAVFFNAAAMAGSAASEWMGCLAVILWLLVNLWLLLRPGVSRPAPEESV